VLGQHTLANWNIVNLAVLFSHIKFVRETGLHSPLLVGTNQAFVRAAAGIIDGMVDAIELVWRHEYLTIEARAQHEPTPLATNTFTFPPDTPHGGLYRESQADMNEVLRQHQERVTQQRDSPFSPVDSANANDIDSDMESDEDRTVESNARPRPTPEHIASRILVSIRQDVEAAERADAEQAAQRWSHDARLDATRRHVRVL
jgi:hypothetical protein